MKKSSLKKRLVVLMTGTALVASTLFTSPVSFSSAEPVPGELIQQEETASYVTLEIPNEATAKKLRELEIDFDHGIHEHDGVWEVEVVVTPSEIKLLEQHGIKVKETLMTEQAWETRVNERNKTIQRNAKLAGQEEKLQILRADHFTNQAATFLYVEAKSSVGAASGTILTAHWKENGEEKSATLTRRSDYGEYLYHYLELAVKDIPATVKVVSNQGSTATSDVKEWLGGDRPDPGEHYVTGFVDHYMAPTEINEKMDQLAEEFPELVEIIEMPHQTNGYRRYAQATMGTVTNSAVVVTSKDWGHNGGNGIEISFVKPDRANNEINVIKTKKKIAVQLATNASGNVTSTASQVVEALNKNASDLLSATTYRGNSGDGIVQVTLATLTDGLKGPQEVSREPMTVKAFRIGKHRDGTKTGVLGYSQEHAREWVTPLVTLETAERLLRNYAHDKETQQLVDNLDIFLIPTINPDGANYSFYDYNSQRRNMTNHCGPNQNSDFAARNTWGVDLNRNHSVGTVFDGYIGASTSCTSDTYAGPEVNSEPEAKNIVWLADNFPNIDFAMNIHSHGGYFMWSPGAYDANRVTLPRPTAGEEEFYWEASEHILAKIQDHRGTVIRPTRTGPIPDVLYSAAGNSADYLWYEKGIYAWNFEVGAELWNGSRWVSVGFQPVYEEGHEEAMEFANGLIGLFEVASQQSEDHTSPVSKAEPGSGRYSGTVEVTIETSEPATVYYTLDGSRPTFDSTKIELSGTREGAGKLNIKGTTTINFFSVDPAGNVENNYDPSGGEKNYNSVTITIGGDQNKEPGTADLKALVERFNKEGAFSNSLSVRQLTTHLTAVESYEKQGESEKALKHINSFIVLLDFQKTNGLISDQAYSSIKAYTEYLIAKWSKPIDSESAFESERAMDHLKYLSVDIGPRVTGSPEEKQAAEYIKNEFTSYGYDVSTQEFSVPNRLAGKLQTSEGAVALSVPTGSAQTNDTGVTGNVVHASLGKPGDFPGEVEGNIALIERGEISFGEKTQNAINAGAIGVILYDNVESLSPFTGTLGITASIPVVGIRQVDGKKLASASEDGGVTATITINQLTNQVSQNVIAVKKPVGIQNPEIVYVTAHYDSVANSPGANDDGSGTVSTLELARILKDVPTNKEIRFITFGAEEIGLVGSRYYVSQLSPDEIARSIASFNLDMVGTAYEPASQLQVSPVDGNPDNLVWKSVKAASDKLGYADDLLNLNPFSRSDHVPFHDAGIDSALFIWMVPGTQGLEPWYHTPEDKIEHVSPVRIQTVGDLIKSAVSDLLSQASKDQSKEGKAA